MSGAPEIPGYEVGREIGAGGIAVVYLAREQELDRDVALKKLHRFHSASSTMVDRFLRESRIAASLRDPNIVAVHRFFTHEGVPYISMEHVPHGTLRPYIGALSLPQFAGVMESVLAGLAHAALRGVVHRDLKPENLLVSDEGRVKIADFGIAKGAASAGVGTFMTKEGMAVGTPTYMAPEQAIASAEIGPWTDLYSVGVIAFEHFVGRPPFRDEAAPVILFRHVNEAIPPACSLNGAVPSDISAWIDRLLRKRPHERTRTPKDAWEELEEIVVRRCGALWRRDARLPHEPARLAGPSTLTPQVIESIDDAPAQLAPEAASDVYITFSRLSSPPADGPPANRPDVLDALDAQPTSESNSRLSARVDLLCAALVDERAEIKDDVERIRTVLREAMNRPMSPLSDARAAGDALSELEHLSWRTVKLAPIRDALERARASDPDLHLTRVAEWYGRAMAGEVHVSPLRLNELEELLSAELTAHRPGASSSSARTQARSWRRFEASPAASPMARRLAADVVRFYERRIESTDSEEQAP